MAPLLVVCRHFWPICNEASYRIAALVRFLGPQTNQLEVITTRWHSKWPATSTFEEVKLTRILPAPTSPWSEGFFCRNLWNWIERNAEQYSHVYVDSLSLLAHAKLSTNLRQRKFIIHFDTALQSEVELLKRPSSTLAALMHSPSCWFTAENAHAHRLMIGAGVAANQIVRIPPTNVWTEPRSPALQFHARNSLQSISQDFIVPPNFPLIIVLFSDEDYESEHRLLKHLVGQLDLGAQFRAWVFGCNDLVRRHYSYLKDMGSHRDILLHSSFDEIELLFHAADLILCPQNHVGKSFYYMQAIAAGTPILFPLTPSRWIGTENDSSLGDYAYAMFSDAIDLEKTLREFLEFPSQFQSVADQRQGLFSWSQMRQDSATAWQRMLQSP